MTLFRYSLCELVGNLDEPKIDLGVETMDTDDCVQSNTVDTVNNEPDEHHHNTGECIRKIEA